MSIISEQKQDKLLIGRIWLDKDDKLLAFWQRVKKEVTKAGRIIGWKYCRNEYHIIEQVSTKGCLIILQSPYIAYCNQVGEIFSAGKYPTYTIGKDLLVY